MPSIIHQDCVIIYGSISYNGNYFIELLPDVDVIRPIVGASAVGRRRSKRRFGKNFFKMGQPRPLLRLFSVFSNKHQYNFYNSM